MKENCNGCVDFPPPSTETSHVNSCCEKNGYVNFAFDGTFISTNEIADFITSSNIRSGEMASLRDVDDCTLASLLRSPVNKRSGGALHEDGARIG